MTTGQLGLRRTAQVRAAIYGHELIEQSARGQRQHAANGYRHGMACYGYIAVVDPDAPPAANRFGGGRPKMRLALHPDRRRADTVAAVFTARRMERKRDAEIARMLAADPDRYPPEEGRRWTQGRVLRMLAQPKYSGYAVYNMRAARTNRERLNPITDWVWSRQLAHPVIVPIEEWYETQLVTAQMRERRISGWERVNDVAARLGVEIATVRENNTHLLCRAGAREFVVPRGTLPAAVADEVIAILEAVR
ncbi:recombinase family protein [Nonomuraea sp. NPDC050663]|uniref:recombinase family protein n=1 Tax=Nonomuraea sp. NPDC050663 TaxID=3364370 RepID=UPI0037B48FB0